jgi:hypothetical protein
MTMPETAMPAEPALAAATDAAPLPDPASALSAEERYWVEIDIDSISDAPVLQVVEDAPAQAAAAAVPAQEPVAAKPARETKPAPKPAKPAKAQKPQPKPKPAQDEWGLFDPQQCGFAALLAKLDEITGDKDEDNDAPDTTTRVLAY